MNNVNDLQKQFENLIKQGQELLEKMKENHIAETNEKVKRWKPERDEYYWYIEVNGNVEEDTWFDNNSDKQSYEFGNVFKSEQEARKERDRRLAEQELLDMCDWNGEEKVCVIVYDVKTNSFDWNWFYEITSPYRFASGESCQKAINTLGTEKLKLIFRID